LLHHNEAVTSHLIPFHFDILVDPESEFEALSLAPEGRRFAKDKEKADGERKGRREGEVEDEDGDGDGDEHEEGDEGDEMLTIKLG
jgi:hypothetical protein